ICEQELYRMGVPPDIDVGSATTAEGPTCLPEWHRDARVGLLVTGDIDTLAMLASDSRGVPRINIGGLQHRPGRSPRLRHAYHSDAEGAATKAQPGRAPPAGAGESGRAHVRTPVPTPYRQSAF